MKTTLSRTVEHPFVTGLRPDHLDIINHDATEMTFEPGQIIFRQAELANQFFLLQSGSVALESVMPGQKPVLIQTLKKGDALGWSWLFPPFRWNFQARAVEGGRAYVLNGAHLLVESSENRDFGYELMKRVAQIIIQRLQANRKQLLEIAGDKLKPINENSYAKKSGVRANPLDALESLIEQHPFLKGIPAEHLKTLANCAMKVQFEPGQLVFEQGDVANRFYLLENGKVALESHVKDKASIPVELITGGDVLGWSWLFPPYYWNFDARAVEKTDAIFFYGTRLREYAEENHALGFELLQRMVKVIINRLQATRRQLLVAESERTAVKS
ncbi:MAG TPA: cyclic nucleotide-binding domain-containing protein [Verrucomicrobiae bacterium]|jgi:CRP-like cAMP-binding protein